MRPKPAGKTLKTRVKSADPTRLSGVRNRFVKQYRRGFDELAKRLEVLILQQDAFGLRPVSNAGYVFGGYNPFGPGLTWPGTGVGVGNGLWSFLSAAEKAKAFGVWVADQIRDTIGGRVVEDLARSIVETGYRRGVYRGVSEAAPKGVTPVPVAEQIVTGTGSVRARELLEHAAKTNLEEAANDLGLKLQRIVTDGIVAGKSADEIVDTLRNQVDVGAGRGDLIVGQELTRSHAEGQLVGIVAMGVQTVGAQVEFTTAGDGKVCPKCSGMSGKVFTVEQARGMIPLHVNCRCAWTPLRGAVPTPNGVPAPVAPVANLSAVADVDWNLSVWVEDDDGPEMIGNYSPAQPRDRRGRWVGLGSIRAAAVSKFGEKVVGAVTKLAERATQLHKTHKTADVKDELAIIGRKLSSIFKASTKGNPNGTDGIAGGGGERGGQGGVTDGRAARPAGAAETGRRQPPDGGERHKAQVDTSTPKGLGESLKKAGASVLEPHTDEERWRWDHPEMVEHNRSVLAAAQTSGTYLPPEHLAGITSRPNVGGMEHNVYFAAEEGRYYKLTKGGHFGQNTDVHEYLRRHEVANELWPELGYKFHGVTRDRDGNAVVVSSMNQIVGTHPQQHEIHQFFESKGFKSNEREVDHENGTWSWKDPKTGTEINDAHTKNFIKVASGRLVPIDVDIIPGKKYRSKTDASGTRASHPGGSGPVPPVAQKPAGGVPAATGGPGGAGADRPGAIGRQPPGFVAAGPGSLASHGGGVAEAPKAGSATAFSKREVTPRVADSVAEVNKKIDRYQTFFNSRGQHEVAGWLHKLREHVNSVGVEHALDSLGSVKEGGKGKVDVQYEGLWKQTGSGTDIKQFVQPYLERHGITIVNTHAMDAHEGKPLVSSMQEHYGGTAAKDWKGTAESFLPAKSGFANKLEESKALPGLERSKDLDVLTGKRVTHLSQEVMDHLDKEYGENKWIVKAYGDQAAAGFGIYFAGRSKAIRQEAQNTLWSAGENLARYGFSLHRNENDRVVGIRHESGQVYGFGSKRYKDSIYGDAKEWAEKARHASIHEKGAALPLGGKEFMVQPAFNVVGVSEADRQAGRTIAPGEARVHVVTRNGKAEVVPHATWIKGESLPVVFENEHTKGLAKAAVDAINALPASEKQGQIYAADALLTDKGYKVVEANPANHTGSSGYLGDSPFVADAYVSHVAGKTPQHVEFIRSLLTKRSK